MTETTKGNSPSTYVLIPGAGGAAWYWSREVDELKSRGRAALAVDLPAGDEAAGLGEYTDAVVTTVGDRRPVILVAQSMGAFTAPIVCGRLPVDLIILVNAMVPAPGETAGDWWANTGQPRAFEEQAARDGRMDDGANNPIDMFFHDVPRDVTAEVMARGEPRQADKPFGEPWPLARWPDVPTRALIGRDDRLFPAEFQRRVLSERLGLEATEIPGGHLVALSRPQELADQLEAYRVEAGLP